jgi:hypothetical protein
MTIKLTKREVVPIKKVTSSMPVKLARADGGWTNIFSGAGIRGQDRKASTTFTAKVFMTEQELIDLYVDDGFAKRVVNLLPGYMLRSGFTIEGDPDEAVMARLEEIKAIIEIDRLLRWNRLFGGAICVMGIDDGSLDMTIPVNTSQIRNVIFLRTYDRYRVNWTTSDLYTDPRSPKYGKVQFYNVFPLGGMKSFRVHETRCLVMDGVDIPDMARSMNNSWGASALQHCYEQIRSLGGIYNGLESIVEEFVTGSLAIKNLAGLINSDQEELVRRRLELLDLSKHIINTMLLDADNEKYEKHASSVAGLGEIVDKFFTALSIVTGIPQRIFLGQQAGGLNNEGKGETDDWNNVVEVAQVTELQPLLETLVKYIMLSKEGAFRGVEPDDWGIKFNPLEVMNDKQVAEIRQINSVTDKNYIDAAVLDPAEVATSRFGGEVYGKEIELMGTRALPEPVDE